MIHPDEVALFKYRGVWYASPNGRTGVPEYRALPASSYAALLTRVEAAEGALEAAYREGFTDCASEANVEAGWRYSAARLALRASGTREGG